FQQELLQADSVLLAEAAEIGARRIFVDGLVRLPEPNGGEPREAFHLLAEGLHRENMTAMLALESTMVGPAAARAPEEFVADTILQLTIEIGRDTSELQSRRDLVCRLLLEKKKKK